MENIPTSGPVVVASNHPGAYDSFAIISRIPRPDVKIIISDIPFFKYMPNARERVLYATSEPSSRMNALRASLRHLEQGGCLVIFATGLIDPDPEVWGEAEASQHLEHWSPSLEMFYEKSAGNQTDCDDYQRRARSGMGGEPVDSYRQAGDRSSVAWQNSGRSSRSSCAQVKNLYTPHISFAPPVTMDELDDGKGEPLRT